MEQKSLFVLRYIQVKLIQCGQNVSSKVLNLLVHATSRILKVNIISVYITHLRQECHNSKFGHFLVIGIKRNVCKCTFNGCSVNAVCKTRRWRAVVSSLHTQKIIALQNLKSYWCRKKRLQMRF